MTKEEILEIIKNKTLKIFPKVPPDKINFNNSLKNLGLNSVDRAEIITLSMEEIGIKVPLIDFAKAKNIEDLVNILHGKKNS